MANEFRIKNALQILKSHPVSNISNNVDIFENYDTSSLATVSSIKSYIDTIDFSSGSGEGITWSTPVDANIVPDTDNKYDLGSPESKFSRIYLDSSTGGLYTYFNNVSAPVFLTPGFTGVNIGLNSGLNSSGEFSTFVGGESGKDSSGNGNVAVGYRAGNSAKGDDNVFLGRNAGLNFIGDDKLIITNGNNWNLIYGDFNEHTLEISGDIVSKPAGTNSRTNDYIIGDYDSQYKSIYTHSIKFSHDTGSLLNRGYRSGLYFYDSSTSTSGVGEGAGFIGTYFERDENLDDFEGAAIDYIAFGMGITIGTQQVQAYRTGELLLRNYMSSIGEYQVKVLTDGIETHGITYIGDKDTDGSWRYRIVGDDLLYERREVGAWEIKQTISGDTNL